MSFPGVNPPPSHNTSTGSMSFLERYPSDWSQVPSGGGYSSPRQGYGVHPRPGHYGEGYPKMGYPPARNRVIPLPGMGYTPDQGWGTPNQGWGTLLGMLYPPSRDRRREYLLRGGRYASCNHWIRWKKSQQKTSTENSDKQLTCVRSMSCPYRCISNGT